MAIGTKKKSKFVSPIIYLLTANAVTWTLSQPAYVKKFEIKISKNGNINLLISWIV